MLAIIPITKLKINNILLIRGKLKKIKYKKTKIIDKTDVFCFAKKIKNTAKKKYSKLKLKFFLFTMLYKL